MPFRIHRSLLVALLLLILHSHSRAADNLPRTWTNNLGVKREATFVRVEGDQVTLLLGSGQLVTMPLDKILPGRSGIHQQFAGRSGARRWLYAGNGHAARSPYPRKIHPAAPCPDSCARSEGAAQGGNLCAISRPWKIADR